MKKLLLIASILFLQCTVSAQELIVNTTHFYGCAGGSTTINDALLTKDGDIVFVGTSECNNDGDMPATPYGKMNVVVGKVDTDFQIKWIRFFGGAQDDRGYKVLENSDGTYTAVATTESSDGDVPSTHATNGIVDVWLVKLDKDGNKIWSKTLGGDGENIPLSITYKPDGGIMIFGAFTVAGHDMPFHYTSSPFLFDWFVASIDSMVISNG